MTNSTTIQARALGLLATLLLVSSCGRACADDTLDLARRVLLPSEGARTSAPRSPATTITYSLAQAIDVAFHHQPRLRVFLETVEEARHKKELAFAPYLPFAVASYGAGHHTLDVHGETDPIGKIPGFTFLPALGSIPIGLHVDTASELADVKMQWLICDFGRRGGHYHQARLGLEIAELQRVRAFQNVALEVTLAYYGVLRARALAKAAREAVHRARDDLDVANKLHDGGVLEKAGALRVAMQLAEAEKRLDSAAGAVDVALAGLNLILGLNVNAATDVLELAAVPANDRSLAACLQAAVERRRELHVATLTMEVAREAGRIARAAYAPKIVAEGAAIDYHQASPRINADLTTGMVKVELGLFEGGRRTAERKEADGKLVSARAHAETIADTIAFEVTGAFSQLQTARRGVELSHPAVTLGEESRRLVRARAEQGDATTSEITDSETALVHAQQDELNAIHDHLIALARLDFAMGVTPFPDAVPHEAREKEHHD